MRGCRGARVAALAFCVVLGVAAPGRPGFAIDPAGSRNFVPPTSVPNYFSNEAVPFHGGVAARPAPPPGADHFNTGVAPASRSVAAPRYYSRKAAASSRRVKQRGRIARGRAAPHRHAARAHSSFRGGKAVMTRAAARAAPRKAAVSRGRPAPNPARHAARGR